MSYILDLKKNAIIEANISLDMLQCAWNNRRIIELEYNTVRFVQS